MNEGPVVYIEDKRGLARRKPLLELKEGDKVVKCIVCGKFATHVDNLHPYETLHDRCNEHFGSFLDLTVYENYGLGVVVCEEHYKMSDAHERMNSMAGWLQSQDDEASKELYKDFCDILRKIDSYIPKKWPKELFGPEK